MSSQMRREVTQAIREASKMLFEAHGTVFTIDGKEEIGILKKNGSIHFQREGFHPKSGDVVTHVPSGRKFTVISGHQQRTSDAFQYYHADVEEIKETKVTRPKPSA